MVFARLLWRGFTRRCPVCGQRHLFRRWFEMLDRCPRCELRFERLDGHLTGALGVNTVFSVLVVVLIGVIGFVLTYPELPVVPLTVMITTVAVVFPIIFYPFSKTVWTAVDLRLRPPEPGEVAPEFAQWMDGSVGDR